ncbi:MAG: hypothetical protein K4H23_02920 [Mollicutes bacterium PWAP]|nr:hypothetical protein [Mollicutes bacterium PWAP]
MQYESKKELFDKLINEDSFLFKIFKNYKFKNMSKENKDKLINSLYVVFSKKQIEQENTKLNVEDIIDSYSNFIEISKPDTKIIDDFLPSSGEYDEIRDRLEKKISIEDKIQKQSIQIDMSDVEYTGVKSVEGENTIEIGVFNEED